MQRRTYIKTIGTSSAVAGLAGCLGDPGGDTDGTDTDTDTDTDGTDTDTDGTETPTEDPTVTIGSDIPYKPFEYETAAGELTGFDVDMAHAIFKEEMGRDYEFEKTAWDGIIPSLNNNNFRVIMSAMTINDERDEKVDFSDPYFTAYQTVIVKKDGDVSSKEDLKGKNVGVQKGTTGEGAAKKLQEGFDGDLTIKRYDQITGAFDALINGQVAGVVNDNTVNAEFANERDDIVFLEGEGEAAEQGKDAPPYLTLTVEEYGIAFREDDDEFREQVNEALAAVKESGRYDEIYSEYFEG